MGARLYTIQIGQGDAAEVQDGFDMFGQPRYVSVPFPVNPQLLKELANKTGGSMYVATDAKALQASFHDVLDKLEKTKFEANIANSTKTCSPSCSCRACCCWLVTPRCVRWSCGGSREVRGTGLAVRKRAGGAGRRRAGRRRRAVDPEREALWRRSAGARTAHRESERAACAQGRAPAVLAVTLSFIALAEPQYGRGTRLIPATNLDVVIVLDYSKSMYAKTSVLPAIYGQNPRSGG